ncbi:MAG: tetratricopeptide repeat protein [Bacteroidetes bacterium]|nr:tetratricopeptide repeat protein [Bacteroidota bacterium]
MITLRLLDKKFKHIVLALLLTGCLIFCGCKNKKQGMVGDKTAESGQRLRSSDDQLRFGVFYIDGCAARMKGNIDEALKLFTECKRIDPASAAVKYELARIYHETGVSDQALLNAKGAAYADPKNEWYQLLLIDCYNALKQYNQSIKLRENLVKNFPLRNEFKEDLAIQYSVMGYYDKSLKIYEDLEKQYGINEQIILNKTRLFKNQKKYKDAEAELLRLSISNPEEPRFYSYLADFYIEHNELEKARNMYDRILAIEPNNPVVNLALHDYYSAQGKTAEAFEYLKKAFMNPDLDVITKEAILISFYKKSQDAVYRTNGYELAKIMIKVHPLTPEANAIYADYLLLDRKIKEAGEYYYKSAINEKGNYRAWEQLIKIDYELSNFDSLEKHSAKAIELFPSQPLVYFYNGIANIQIRNFKKATQSLKDGIEFVSDNKAQMLDFYSSLGDAYNYSKEFEKSDKAFEDALKIDTDNTFVLNQYSYFLSLRKENLDKAEKLSKKANELQPGNRSYMDTYGWILFQQKKFSEAEEWLHNAAKLGPDNANILEHYGDVLYKQNKTVEAVKQWEKAKAIGGNSEELNKKIKEKKLND